MSFPVPYPYQSTLLGNVRKGWADGFRKQLVVAPTGAGKTKCFSWQAQEEVNAGRRVLILVDQKELITQTVNQLKETTGIDGQVERAEFHASKMCPVVIATIQTMDSRMTTWPADHFDLVIADEGDKSISDQWQRVLKYFDPTARVCAYTATPNRTDKRSLGEYYENIAFEISLLELVNQKYLSPICIQMAPLKIDLTKVHMDGGDYDVNELDHAITPYLSSAIEVIKQFALNRKTLVFLPLIRTSEAFVKLCREAGLAAEHIDGKSEDRVEKLARFKRNEFNILANSLLLTRGYDDPEINCVFFLRPTKSATLFRQGIGRGTRKAHGKDNLLLIDCLWQTSKHMVMRPANLIAETQEEADEMTRLSEEKMGNPEGEDLVGLQVSARHEREEALRKKLEAMADRKAKFISPEQFALEHHHMEIAEFEPVMKWEFEPVSAKQSPWIEKAGVNPDLVRGKGHASKILDVYFKELGAQPASNGQRYRMRQSGWRSSDGKRGPNEATRDDAKKFFSELNKPQPQGYFKPAPSHFDGGWE